MSPAEIPSTDHGQPIEPSVRETMDQRLGGDFSAVRIHAGETAARSAQQFRAKAYARGNDVVFNSGQYAPQTAQGQWLLAHELAHVAQQSGGAEMIQCDPLDKPTPAIAAGSLEEALGIPLTPEDIWQQLLQRRAVPLSSPASVVAQAPEHLKALDAKVLDATERLGKANGAGRAGIVKELRDLTQQQRQLSRGVELGTIGAGRSAGTGQITYAAIQVEDAAGRRIALEFAETTASQHAEEVIVARLREKVAQGALREAELKGARMLVVGDQFVCLNAGRCRTAVGEFAKDYNLRSVEGSVFQRESFVKPGELASPRTTLTSMTKSSGQPAPLMRQDETLYFDPAQGHGGSGPHSAAARPANAEPAAAQVAEHQAESTVRRVGFGGFIS